MIYHELDSQIIIKNDTKNKDQSWSATCVAFENEFTAYDCRETEVLDELEKDMIEYANQVERVKQEVLEQIAKRRKEIEEQGGEPPYEPNRYYL